MTVRELFTIQDPKQLEALQAIRPYLKASNKLCKYTCGELVELPFKTVETVKTLYAKGDLVGMCCTLLECDTKEVLKAEYKAFLYFLQYVEAQLLRVYQLEQKLNEPSEGDEQRTMRMEQAGAKELNPFGMLNTIDALAQGDLLKWEEIQELPYNMVHTKLLMSKVQHNVQRRYDEIIINESKST